jgi:hypothetical protein
MIYAVSKAKNLHGYFIRISVKICVAFLVPGAKYSLSLFGENGILLQEGPTTYEDT